MGKRQAVQTIGLHRKRIILQFLHSSKALLQLCDEIAVLGSLFPLGSNNSLGSTGDKLLIGQLGFQGVQDCIVPAKPFQCLWNIPASSVLYVLT